MSTPYPRLAATIFWVGLLVGFLDISAALIQFGIKYPDRDPLIVLRYIASAVFGRERAYSESSMIFLGAALHFLIAYCFTTAFFLLYPHVQFLRKNRLVTGIVYGLFIWMIMNLLVVPNSRINPPTFHLKDAAIAAAILIIAIGIPLSFLAYEFYFGKKQRQPEAGAD